MPGTAQVCALPSWPLPKAVGAGVSLQVAHSDGALLVLPSAHTAHEGWSVLLTQQFPGRCFCQCVTVSGWMQGGCTWHRSHGRCWCQSFPLSLPFTVVSASQRHMQSTFSPEAFAVAALNIKGAWGGRSVLKLRRRARDQHCGHHPGVCQCICLILPAGFLTKAYLGSKPEASFGDLAPMPVGL